MLSGKKEPKELPAGAWKLREGVVGQPSLSVVHYMIAAVLLGLSCRGAGMGLSWRGPGMGAARHTQRLAALRMTTSSEAELFQCTVVQLKDKLRAAGLPVSGRKAELIERLNNAPTASDPLAFAASDAMGTIPPIVIEACKS